MNVWGLKKSKQDIMPTLCLVMIVKDEEKIIERCLSRVTSIIDYWVICDTGSTYNTKSLILEYLKDIPGELLEHEWKNFGHNRSLAVAHARNKADYLLLLDADHQLNIYNKQFKEGLDEDGYFIKYENNFSYRQMLLVRGNKKWRYVGATHEFITCDEPIETDMLDDITITDKYDGYNTKDKYSRDVKLLLEEIKNEPNNIRHHFYLGQSYFYLKDYDNAIKFYENASK